MAVNLHTTHYRFGINELAESTHGWHAALDTNPAQGVIAVDTTFLLRFTVQETGGTAAGNTDQQFQCRKNLGAWQDITTTSSIVKAVTTTVFANGADLTKRLTGTGTFESSGDGGTHDGLSGGPQNDIVASGNSETECALQIIGADVAGDDSIEFRLTSPDFSITNDVVPTLVVEGAEILSPGGIASLEVFGSASERLTLPVVGAIPSAEAFGAASAILRLIATAIDSSEAIGLATLSEGDTIAPAGIPSAEAFGTAREVLAILAAGLASEEVLGASREVLALFPGGMVSAEAHGAHTVVVLTILSPSGLVSQEAFGVPTQALQLSGFVGIASAEAMGNMSRPKRQLIGEDWSTQGAAVVIVND